MKKSVKVFLILASFAGSYPAFAAVSDSITVLVTPTGTKGVSIDATEYNYGTKSVNGSAHISTATITVQNTGTISSSWSLKVDNTGTDWNIANSAAADTYSLQAIFNSVQPSAGDFNLIEDNLSAVDQQCISPGKFGGDQNCMNVPPSATRSLWLKLGMPTSSNVENQQRIGVVITAS